MFWQKVLGLIIDACKEAPSHKLFSKRTKPGPSGMFFLLCFFSSKGGHLKNEKLSRNNQVFPFRYPKRFVYLGDCAAYYVACSFQ
jgi:hypothetical protein